MAEESVSKAQTVTDTPLISDDGYRIHPHVFSFLAKKSQSPDFKKQLLRRLKGVGDTKTLKLQIEEYATFLTQARAELLAKLEASSAADIEREVNSRFQDYLSFLVGIVFHTAETPANSVPAANGLTQQQHISMMRDAVRFDWQDAIFSQQGIEAADSVFELASVLVAKAGWEFRRAAYLCRDTRPGISTDQAVKAYKLLLSAAGSLAYVKERCCPILKNKTVSADCSFQAVSSLHSIALADAQAITTLRAMAKNSQPGLIAGLALDTANLYREAANFANNAPFSVPGNKAAKYGAYKAAAFQAYALCFTGLARLKEGEAGQAVRLQEESKAVAHGAIPLAAAFNKAQPSSPAADHGEFDNDLRICVDSAFTKAKKENDHVYYKRPPQELPPLQQAQRLVKGPAFTVPNAHPIVPELAKLDAFSAAPMPELGPEPTGQGLRATPPLSSPAAGPAASQQAQTTGDKQGAAASQEEKPACWRWLLVIIAMPFLAILTVVGLVIWLILLPIKIICCPIGCLIQIIADVVEYLVKAPFKALLWASGKPYKQKERDVESQS